MSAIELIPVDRDDVIGFHINGKVDADDIQHITQVVEEKLKTHPSLRIYAEVERMPGMTIEAFWTDLVFALKHFRAFDKEAIVSDRAWMKRMADIGDRLASSVEVKHFPWSDKAKALAWITQ